MQKGNLKIKNPIIRKDAYHIGSQNFKSHTVIPSNVLFYIPPMITN